MKWVKPRFMRRYNELRTHAEFIEEGDEVLALVDDPAREQLAKFLSRPVE